MTDPDWEPVMKRAAAIVTNRGGRTCHAAIIARELGIPAVVGCGDATRVLNEGDAVTVSCAEGDTGHVYEGLLPIEIIDVQLDKMPPAPTKIMMNVGNPELAFEFQRLPNEGVGLARLEFIIARNVGIHPKALLEFDRQPGDLKREIEAKHRRLRQPDRVLRPEDRRGRGHDRGRVLPQEGDRAAVGLQVQRIHEPAGRQALRAARGKPDAGLPRRIALHRTGVLRLLRARMRGDEARARRHGPHQRRDHDPVRAHADRGREGDRAARRATA